MTLKQRLSKIEKMPDNAMFFFQSYGYVGNSINFWASGGSGYTTDPYKAQQYTKEQTINQLKCGRSQDSFYLVEDILSIVSHHVDAQNLKSHSKI